MHVLLFNGKVNNVKFLLFTGKQTMRCERDMFFPETEGER